MCGPVVPWDWFIIDMSYVLVLVGGGMVFRARGASVATWMLFGMLSVFVGTCLFYFTWDANQAFQAAAAAGTPIQSLTMQC